MKPFWQLADHGGYIACGDKQVTYQELIEKVNVRYFALSKNSKLLCALVAHNNLEFLVTYLSLLQANHTILLIDPKKTQAEISSVSKHFKVNYLFDGAQVTELESIQHSLGDDLALLLPTSGSSGVPKLVKLTYRNLIENYEGILSVLPITKEDRVMTSLPLSYSFGLSILHTHLAVGANIIMGQESLMSKPFWQTFEAHKITSFYGVPFSFELLHRLRFERLPLSNLKYMAQAGGRLSDNLWHALQKFSKDSSISFYAMYGQTEATARIAIMKPENFLSNSPGAIGDPLPNCQLYIDNTDDEGELLFKGKNIFAGYASQIEDLAVCHIFDVLKTGDIARKNSSGSFTIVGRSKRISKLEGRRINLDELEQSIAQKLNKQVVIKSDDKRLNVYIECHADGLEKSIAEIAPCHVRQIKVIQIDSIPRLSNGKVDYHALD